jgi:hypothetical protein
MYIRRTKTKTTDSGKAYFTYRIVESVRMGKQPVAYVVLCVRFVHPPLFPFAAVETASNAPPDTQHSIWVAG